MKSKRMNMVVGIALLVALTIAGTITTTPALAAQKSDSSAQNEAQGKKLEGTWRVQVSIRDCQSGAPLRTFPAFLTFAQGGTLTETTTGFPPALRSPGHGFWQHTGGRSYLAVSEAFLFSPAGVWTGTQRLTQVIEIGHNGDELTSNATNEIFDTNRNLIVSGCATAVASRFD
ncbi:MAG: hypothetical protein ABJB97_04690 [Acidobacteriota bacterium]